MIFENEVFKGTNRFFDCIFYENVSFRSAVFKGETWFSGAIFQKYAIFDLAIFEKKVFYTASHFQDLANFVGTKFLDEVSFHNVSFSTYLTFSGVKFVKSTDFTQLNLQSANVRFIECYFSGNTIFRYGWKGKEIVPALAGAKLIEFLMCEIDPSKPPIFRNVDMSHVYFYDTRLSNVEFTNVIWPKISDLFGFKRLAIYNEIETLERLKSEKDKGKIKEIKSIFIHQERIYRDLKSNYENDRDWVRAGDFHYGEKEMRRMNPDTNFIFRFFLTIYWILSGYGERYLRPIFWTFFLLLICTLGYLYFGIAPNGIKNQVLQISKINDWVNAALYGLQVITLQKPIDLQPISLLSKIIKVFQSIFGPIILGFFALAIRQRMRR